MNYKHQATVSAVKCYSYENQILREKIREAVLLAGGYPKKVKPGAKALIKPNILTAREPEYAVTTHCEFVRAVIQEIREFGVHIYVGDSPAGNHDWDKLWSKTGLKKVCEEEGVNLIAFEEIKMIEVEGHRIPILKELDDFDVFISIPKLKTHILTKITGSVKNSYGLVIGDSKSHFHSIYPSPMKMSIFIGKIYGKLKPDFVIMDAIQCMEGEGPNTGTPANSNLIFASFDGVALDSCASGIFGYSGEDIQHLKTASECGYGISKNEHIQNAGDGWSLVESLKLKRSNADFLFKIPEKFFFIISMVCKTRPSINNNNCVKCGICSQICMRKAIVFRKNRYKASSSKCILCMCCIEACPHRAITLKTGKIASLWSSLPQGISFKGLKQRILKKFRKV